MKASLYDTFLAYANLIDHRAQEQRLEKEREREKEKEREREKVI